MGLTAIAQKNQTKASSNSNQTAVTPAGKQVTKIINQTNIPANQTSTTVEKKTEPVGKTPLPVNQTKISPPSSQAKLPTVSNKTNSQQHHQQPNNPPNTTPSNQTGSNSAIQSDYPKFQ